MRLNKNIMKCCGIMNTLLNKSNYCGKVVIIHIMKIINVVIYI